MVTRSVPVSVVVLGGLKSSFIDTQQIVQRAVKSCAAGAAIGRNIFQHSDSVKATKAFMMAIHTDKPLSEILRELAVPEQ